MPARASAKPPQRGEAVWLDFDPQSGHEQAGRRPALFLSPAAYNARTGLALCCPITSRAKGYPFECVLPPGLPIQGVVLADQVRCFDWRSRRATAICKLPADFLDEVVARILPLLGHED